MQSYDPPTIDVARRLAQARLIARLVPSTAEVARRVAEAREAQSYRWAA